MNIYWWGESIGWCVTYVREEGGGSDLREKHNVKIFNSKRRDANFFVYM